MKIKKKLEASDILNYLIIDLIQVPPVAVPNDPAILDHVFGNALMIKLFWCYFRVFANALMVVFLTYYYLLLMFRNGFWGIKISFYVGFKLMEASLDSYRFSKMNSFFFPFANIWAGIDGNMVELMSSGQNCVKVVSAIGSISRPFPKEVRNHNLNYQKCQIQQCLCDVVHPWFQEQLIHPALKGTLNILGTCSKVSTVKRVVVTSSVVAVFTITCLGLGLLM
ncbi:NAD-dependent epimerase/dehydratase [Artemisia annua]|uniref:NAD-dependent epimerase/dehydratase n=1 Tax=Artemisia annua TaxID=35608 RepID=A0A2U1MNM1_ARTAN|nr:NAD-dependent epimerase/dehydratase [Artemisia annua]